MNYNNWGIDQHPSSGLLQMEKQILEWDIFVSVFQYSKKYWYVSCWVHCFSDIKDFNFSWYTQKQENKIRKYKNCWILGKRIIPMWNWRHIVYPFAIWTSTKGRLKKLLILRKAYSWTDKLNGVLEEIEKIERREEMTIEEIIDRK